MAGSTPASSLFRIGQAIKGNASQYVITSRLQDTVWLAKLVAPIFYIAKDTLANRGGNARNAIQETVVIKSVRGHFRVANERDVLRRFGGQSPCIRPLLDEIVEPPEPVTIVLRYLESNLLRASTEKKLNRVELKYVSRRVLQALRALHSQGYVHSGKPVSVRINQELVLLTP